MFQKALKAYRTGHIQSARHLLIEFLQGEPQNAQAWYWLGETTADVDKKRLAFEHALQLKPNYAEARAALAQLQQQHIRTTLDLWQIELTDLYAEAKA
ncbi:MAG: hypothetical protein KC421_20165, partial [Anaerolineales bacterium]|nr:hypothetical protein [Anaerolineales bacterium]